MLKPFSNFPDSLRHLEYQIR